VHGDRRDVRLAGCTVAGYGTGDGTHTLTATATDRAGNVSTRTLTYAVTTPAAIAKLTATRVSRRALLATGLPVHVRAALARTRLTATVTAKVHGRRTTVATASRTVGAGTRALRLRLSKRGRARLRGVARPTLTVTVKGRATNARTTTLKATVRVRR